MGELHIFTKHMKKENYSDEHHKQIDTHNLIYRNKFYTAIKNKTKRLYVTLHLYK